MDSDRRLGPGVDGVSLEGVMDDNKENLNTEDSRAPDESVVPEPAVPVAPPAEFAIRLSPRFLVVLLAVVAAALVTTHAALTIYHYQVSELEWLPWRQLFDVDEENNLPTWFSEFLLLTTTCLLWLCTKRKKAQADPSIDHWYTLTLGFLVLSIDEVAGMHETINSMIDPTWAYGGGILAMGIGIGFIPFLRRLPRSTAGLFILAGAIYIGGAVGMEIIGEPLDSDTLTYNLLTAVEEGMEMFGVILFIHALLRHMKGVERGDFRASVQVG